jgi:hypothetical protein
MPTKTTRATGDSVIIKMADQNQMVSDLSPIDPALLASAEYWYPIAWKGLLVAGAITAIGACATIGFLLLQWRTSTIREQQSEWRTSALEVQSKRADADLAQAKASISVADARAAEANARALEAQVKLEKFKKPRSISVEQRNRIAEEMKKFSGQQYFGMVASDVADAWDIWREISLSLEIAGWKRIPPPGLSVTQYGPPAGIPLAPQAGVMVLSSTTNSTPEENMALHERAKALAAQLTTESILAGAGFSIELNPNTIAIVIGPKP